MMKILALPAMAGVLFASTAAMAQVELSIGWTTSDGETDPYAVTARALSDALEEVAPGEFKLNYFPNRQLGDELQMLEGMNFGTVDMGIITNAVIANVEPAFMLNDLPFLYPDAETAHEVLDGEVGDDLMSSLEAQGIVGLGFAEGGFRHMINNVRPVSSPADVEGVKYRVMQNPVFIGMFTSLGGNAVPMAWGETYTAVQQGTIDGLEIPLAVIAANQYPEVTEYLSLTRHTYSALGVLMSKAIYDGLSEEQQAALQEATDLAISRARETTAANEAAVLEEIRAAGMEVNDISDPAAFRESVAEVYDRFRPEIGDALMDKALTAVE